MTKKKCPLSLHIRFAATLLAIPALVQTAYGEQDLTWDANGAAAGTGGSGTWDTSSSNWLNGTGSQPWQNSAFDNAIFGGTPGTVTLSTPVNVHNIIYSASDYVINGGMLILGGDGPSIIVNGPVATINSNLGGSSGFRKSGTGTLIVTGDNLDFDGVTTVTAGTLRIDNPGALGTSTAASDLVLSKGSTFFFNTDFTHDYTLSGSTVNVRGGEGTTWNGSPTLTLSTIMNLNGANGTLSGNLGDTGARVLSLTRNGTGRMTLSGNNTYTGAGQVRWVGDGGFHSSGSNQIVDIGGSRCHAGVGERRFCAYRNQFVLGTSSNGMLDFQNGIDLGGALRTVQVEGGSPGRHARINGVLSETGGLNVAGNGASLLELTAANTYRAARS